MKISNNRQNVTVL